MSMLEAKCTRCEEIFVPHSTDLEDLIHGVITYTEGRIDEECGGIGIIQGAWMTPSDVLLFPNMSRRLAKQMAQFEAHGNTEPDCTDENCVWHHPPSRELEPFLAEAKPHSDSC